MSSADHGCQNPSKSVCVGTGFVTLDLVMNENDPTSPPKLCAGGSCGNVMTILAYLGWDSYPIARLGNDTAAKPLLADFKHWDVKTRFVTQYPTDDTPIIVQKIGVGYSGTPWHRFEWTCPGCNSALPRYKPVLLKEAAQLEKSWPPHQAFYFDRVTPSAVRLATASKEQGAMIIFEPSAVKDDTLFNVCLQVADIVKYSHDRLGHVPELAVGTGVPLQIETLGAQGLRYQLGCERGRWKTIQPLRVENLRDAAGAGDWCSAGVIHSLAKGDFMTLHNAAETDIIQALNFGQGLAAINCRYEGARGSMYSLSQTQFEVAVHELLEGAVPVSTTSRKPSMTPLHHLRGICPGCVEK